MWRDPLDELIEDLKRALPSTAHTDEHLPRLEDLQAVISPILFGTEEDKKRIFANPQYQRLSDTVMRQLARIRDASSEAPVSRDSQLGPSEPSTVNGQARSPVSAPSPPAGITICLCGADEDGEHTPDCPLADANIW